jgi:Putative beta-lactamase-inhibitor-like, PepSY-like
MRTLFQALGAAAVLSLAVLGARGGEEEDIPLAKVPQKVITKVKAKYPGADLRSARRGEEDKEVYYTVVLEYKDDEYEVTLTPEGEVTEVARDIEIKDLPRAVSEAVGKKYPGAVLKEASEVREPDEKGKLTYYVELTTAEKKALAVTFDPKGQFVKEEEVKEQKK